MHKKALGACQQRRTAGEKNGKTDWKEPGGIIDPDYVHSISPWEKEIFWARRSHSASPGLRGRRCCGGAGMHSLQFNKQRDNTTTSGEACEETSSALTHTDVNIRGFVELFLPPNSASGFLPAFSHTSDQNQTINQSLALCGQPFIWGHHLLRCLSLSLRSRLNANAGV